MDQIPASPIPDIRLPLKPNQERKLPTAVIGLLSYLSLLCFVPLLLEKPGTFERYHAVQGTALFVASLIGMGIGKLLPPGIGSVVFASVVVLEIVLAVVGTRNVALGQREALPFLGRLLISLHLS